MKRGGRLQRRTRLRPGDKPLTRKTPLRPVSPKKATAQSKPAPRRETGPDRATRELCAGRDGYACGWCGRPLAAGWRSLQHRLARGQGGDNRPSNLIWLCGSATSPGCHLRAEQRTEEGRLRGFWVPSWEDPAEVPVLHAAYGWVLLVDDGSTEPVGRAA